MLVSGRHHGRPASSPASSRLRRAHDSEHGAWRCCWGCSFRPRRLLGWRSGHARDKTVPGSMPMLLVGGSIVGVRVNLRARAQPRAMACGRHGPAFGRASIAATLTFMAATAVTVIVVAHGDREARPCTYPFHLPHRRGSSSGTGQIVVIRAWTNPAKGPIELLTTWREPGPQSCPSSMGGAFDRPPRSAYRIVFGLWCRAPDRSRAALHAPSDPAQSREYSPQRSGPAARPLLIATGGASRASVRTPRPCPRS